MMKLKENEKKKILGGQRAGEFGVGEDHMDKIEHFMFFFSFTYSSLFFTNKLANKLFNVALLAFVFFMTFCAEYIQIYMPNRQFDYFDILANFNGLAIAAIIFHIYYLFLARKR